MAKCIKYGKNTYKPNILFDKIRSNPEFFAKKHKITGADVENVLGIGDNNIDFQIPTPQKPKNLMPKILITQIGDAVKSGGKGADVMNVVNKSNWFKGLGKTTQENMTFADVKETLVDSDRYHKENDKVRAKERMDKSKAESEVEKAKRDTKLAEANPLKADDKIIYTNDKPRNKFIAWKEKWFSNEGGILKPVMNFQDKATGKTNMEIRSAKDLIARLSAEANKSNFYTEADWAKFDTALRGEKDSVEAYNELPDGIKPFVNEMRMKIDGLSEFLVENDLVTPAQAVTIEENKGQYVSRAYEFFESKDSVGKIFRRIFANGNISKQFDEAKWNDAVTAYQQNVLNSIATDGSGKYNSWTDAEKQAFARKEGQRLLEAYILELSSDYNQAKSTKGANVDILKERKDVPVEIRRLLGEYTDPRVAYGVTIAKMSQMAYQRKFLQQVRDIGIGTLFFKEGDPNIPSTHTVKIASYSNQAYSPLSGLYTTPEFKDVFLDIAEPQTKDWINLWIKVTGAFKYGKTILSPMTQAVNFTANFGFLTMNGLYDIRGFAAGAKVFADEIRVSKKNDPFIQELIEENVIGQNIQLNEIENDFHKNIEKTIINDIKRAPLTKNILGYTVMLPQKMYKASDDFFKAYAYFQETNDYAKSIYGKPYKELVGEERARIRSLASEVVKNTLANYDRKYKAADVVRKGTRNLLGNFLSFQAESIRTLINATQIGLRDIQNPETRSVGLRRLAGVMAYNATYATITSYLGNLAGIGLTGLLSAFNDDDEEEKNKKLNYIVAPWARSTEKYFRIEKDGTLTYFTYGNINPYGITYRVMNAYKNGTDNTNKGGALAMLGELTEPFVSTEMSVKWLINVYAGKNDYGKELVGQQDYIDYTVNKLSPTFIKLWKDNNDGSKNNDFEMINVAGIKKYNIDLTDQLNFRFSDYQKKVNDIGKEIYGLQYKVADGKMSPEEAEEKHKELILKQKKITDDFIPVMEAHISFGASIDKKGGVLDKGSKTYLNIFNSSRDWMPYLLAPEEARKEIEKTLNK